MKYEYNQLYISFSDVGLDHTDKLNSIGNDGWELVSAVKVDHETILYVFKKELTKNEKQLLNG